MLSNAIKFCFRALLLLMAGVQLGEVRAEGTYQMDATAPQHLETDTLLFIHVDSASKYIRVHLCREYYQSGPVYADIYSTSLVNGKYVKNTKLADLSSTQGNISCSDDMTSALPATPASGEAMQYQVSSAGVYAVDFTDISDNFERWDVSVVANASDSVDPTASDGNLFSYLWRFDTPWYTEPYASDTKLYVLTPGGYSNTNYVWAVDLQGFAGDIYKFQASDIGLNWPDSGRSASLYTATISEKYPTYLSYPTGASPSSSPSTAPALTGTASFTDSAGNDNEFTPNGDTIEDTGTFSFTPNATGTYAISVAAFGGSYEQVMVGSMTENVQVNAVWDGKDRDGNAMVPAKYDVKVTLKLGEMHFVVKDVETSGGGSNDGLTLLQATNSSTLVGTQVYWDDTGIGGSGNLPNGVLSSTATTGTHRHTWGDFTSTSYADLMYVDTYTWGQTSDFSTELIYVNPAAPTITSNGGGQEASIEVNEGTTLVTNVVATGGSGSYTYSIFGDDAALFSISASGQLTFNSAPDYGSPADADTDNFYHLYVRVDGGGTLEYIHQELTIEVNNLPVADAQSVSVTEDVARAITLTSSDSDGDTLTYSIVSSPSDGALSGTLPNITYTPDADFNGADSFTFKVNDGFTDSNTATVSLTVAAVNDLPTANAQSVTVTEDIAKAITLSGADVDGDSLTYSLVSSPSNGVLTGTIPNLSYTPNADYNGADSFTFKVNDGTGDSGTATVSITVNAVNDAPVADAQSVAVTEDISKSITLTGSDTEGSSLTYSIVNSPSDGALSGTLPNITYTPDADFNGADSFTFKVNDGGLDSATVTVSLTVEAVNDLPTANAQSVTVTEDIAKAITLSGADVDGDSLTYSLVSSPSNGVLTGTIPNLSYTPNADYNGADSFTFKVNDGTGDSGTATVSITVNAVNDAPVADAQSVAVTEDISKGITLTGSDTEGSSLTYSIVSSPSNGSVSGTPPNISYSPNANFNGSDSFTFKVNDGGLDSPTATVSLTVAAVNDLPTANAQSVTVTEDIAKAITLSGADVDGDGLTYNLVSSPSNGVLTGTIPNLSYTPNADYNGADSFTFKVNDGTGDSGTATVSITVNAVNDAPVADAQSVAVTEDISKSITLTGSDTEGSSLGYFISPPSNGALSGGARVSGGRFYTSTGAITYTPDANFNGIDSFTFVVNDGTEDSAAATVTLTIAAVNDLPTANAQSVTVTEDITKAITLSGADVDGDSLTYSLVSSPSNGVLTGTIPNFSYTPSADYNGADSFSFKVNDGSGDSNTAMITINVVEKNDAPVANSQTLELVQGTAVAILLGASDPEGQSLSYLLTSYPEQGVLSGSEANLTYTPDADFSGSDSFNFIANDGELDSNTAVVTLVVLGDLDGDGIPDEQDADDDGDGIDDLTEGTGDSDGDGIPDYRDTDSDNDGIPDGEEGIADTDGDGTPDYLDSSVDEDHDGIPDILEGTDDPDGDGLPSYLDNDDDNDGLLDSYEAGLTGNDSDGDGIDDLFDIDVTKGVDNNADGIDDAAELRDSDADGIPDYLDVDSDNDLIPDNIEATLVRIDTDSDGIGDPYDVDFTLGQDSDGDGIDDRFDIDLTGYLDADQDGICDTQMLEKDTDLDGVADFLDQDVDNDGVIDTAEVLIPGGAGGSLVGWAQVGQLTDEIQLLDQDGDGVPDLKDLDSDNDGIMDVVEAGGLDINEDGLADAGNELILIPADTDADGIPDIADLDSDNDGVADIRETPAYLLDLNDDGRIDFSADLDADGIDDAWDNAPGQFGTAVSVDPDGDGIPIGLDKDNDNDGLSDLQEGTGDWDQDNVADYLDRDSDNDGLSDTFENGLPPALALDTDLDGIDDAWDIDAVGGLDDDGDGIADRFKPLDTDADGSPNQIDIDSDGDTLPDWVEQVITELSGTDTNLNGVDDAIDVLVTQGADTDFDGIDDDSIAAGAANDMGDVDQDGILNFIDLDSDGDGIPDEEEGEQDTDRDGSPDYLDIDSDNDGILDRDENTDANGDGIRDCLQAESSKKGKYDSGGAVFAVVIILLLLLGSRRVSRNTTRFLSLRSRTGGA
ncbi:Ig-like domain-containing protein [Shewanella submarina]|uniref:Ig-like domain-containing protein n=1 Tax=Shewanella submarina TaxID=2016376 RepID=A0ABV7GBL0_9GAMM|nr:Ig-like domain-containing protein [Shewanella submarina]MCL1038529.1 Ig-like domain-containing protein [Shewanella submarina]